MEPRAAQLLTLAAGCLGEKRRFRSASPRNFDSWGIEDSAPGTLSNTPGRMSEPPCNGPAGSIHLAQPLSFPRDRPASDEIAAFVNELTAGDFDRELSGGQTEVAQFQRKQLFGMDEGCWTSITLRRSTTPMDMASATKYSLKLARRCDN